MAIPLPTASEFESEKACKALRQVITAAENSNQMGENLSVVMANGPELYQRVHALEQVLNEIQALAHDDANEQHEWSAGDMADALRSIDRLTRAAIGPATPA